MKKYYMASILALIIIVIFAVVLNNNLSTKKSESFTVYEEDGYYISKYGKIARKEWEKLDHKESGYESPKIFLLDIDNYVDDISAYIGTSNWKDVYKNKHGDGFEFKINLSFTDGASHVAGGYNHFKYLMLDVKLKKSLFEHNFAPIAHEITHLIAPYYSSLSLREGLASFIQDTIGKNPSLFNKGEPIITLSKELLIEDNIEKNTVVIKSIGTKGIPKDIDIYTSDIQARRMFYILSHSFSKYLIDEHGIEKFMKVYEAENLYTKYEEVYGKNLDELKNDWIDYVIEYEVSPKKFK